MGDCEDSIGGSGDRRSRLILYPAENWGNVRSVLCVASSFEPRLERVMKYSPFAMTSLCKRRPFLERYILF